MIACAFIPRLGLRAACGAGSLQGPAALAPLPGGRPVVGEASAAAERQGVSAGMPLNEALARCPELRLVAPDPARSAQLWEGVLRGLEGIGASLESERPGEAFFEVDGLEGLYGDDAAGVLAAARRGAGAPVRLAAAPTRFAAFAAARRGPRLPRSVHGVRAEAIVPATALLAFLRPLPVSMLESRLSGAERQAAELPTDLRRLGIRTLGALAQLPTAKVADRFGSLGLEALRLARGKDTPLRPRRAHEQVSAEIELPEGVAGSQLDRALELLADRLLASPQRRGRTVLALRLDARLCGGGSWSVEQVLARPGATAATLCLLLAPKLSGLPSPAEALALHATRLGPAGGEQLFLMQEEGSPRLGRLGKSIRELRALQGPEALLKVVELDPRSHLPERRLVLTPYPEP